MYHYNLFSGVLVEFKPAVNIYELNLTCAVALDRDKKSILVP